MNEFRELDTVRWARRVLIETDSGREAVRAYFYAVERGVPHAAAGGFGTPSCDSWECLSPEHQSWIVPSRGLDDPSAVGQPARGRTPDVVEG